jgi:toxin ParE1/3/4
MSGYLLASYAQQQLDQIYEYIAIQLDEDQAERYVAQLFDYFSDISSKNVIWRAVPAEFGVHGYLGKCGHHFVYWKLLAAGDVGIVAVLHERMHLIAQIRNVFDEPL